MLVNFFEDYTRKIRSLHPLFVYSPPPVIFATSPSSSTDVICIVSACPLIIYRKGFPCPFNSVCFEYAMVQTANELNNPLYVNKLLVKWNGKSMTESTDVHFSISPNVTTYSTKLFIVENLKYNEYIST